MILSFLQNSRYGSPSGEENPLWLVVLCDMMTNLMLFFLIMYGFTRQPEESRKAMMQAMSNQFKETKETPVAQKAKAVVQKVQEEDVTELLKKKQFAQVEVTEQHIRVTLTNPVLFVSGESELSEPAKQDLQNLAALLARLPNTILVEGHTDNIPIRHESYASNWQLSVARAYSVIDFFTNSCRLSPDRFVTAGYGEFRPISTNETVEGRARNRRIEISILRNKSA